MLSFPTAALVLTTVTGIVVGVAYALIDDTYNRVRGEFDQ